MVTDDEGGDDETSARKFEEDSKVESRNRWFAFAGERVRRGVELVALPRTNKTLIESLRASRTFNKKTEPGTFRIIMYNAKADGECKTQASVRLPVLRAGYLTRVVHAALQSRAPAAEGEEQPAVLAEED